MTSKALIGKERIMQYLGISRHRFAELYKSGLPAQKRGGCWCANADELDEWFRCSEAGNSKV